MQEGRLHAGQATGELWWEARLGRVGECASRRVTAGPALSMRANPFNASFGSVASAPMKAAASSAAEPRKGSASAAASLRPHTFDKAANPAGIKGRPASIFSMASTNVGRPRRGRPSRPRERRAALSALHRDEWSLSATICSERDVMARLLRRLETSVTATKSTKVAPSSSTMHREAVSRPGAASSCTRTKVSSFSSTACSSWLGRLKGARSG